MDTPKKKTVISFEKKNVSFEGEGTKKAHELFRSWNSIHVLE